MSAAGPNLDVVLRMIARSRAWQKEQAQAAKYARALKMRKTVTRPTAKVNRTAVTK